jgi:hypothetical protein
VLSTGTSTAAGEEDEEEGALHLIETSVRRAITNGLGFKTNITLTEDPTVPNSFKSSDRSLLSILSSIRYRRC